MLFGRVITGGVHPDDLVVERQMHRAGHQGDLDGPASIVRPTRYTLPAKLSEPLPSTVRVTLGARWWTSSELACVR